MSDDLCADLEASLDAIEAAEDRRVVSDDGHANYCMRKLRDAHAEMAELDGAMAEYRAWYERHAKRIRDEIAFREGQLQDYARRRLAEDGVKTLDLPAGSVKSRTSKASVVIDDLIAVADWCTDRGFDIVEFAPKVKVTDVRKYVEAHGGMAVDPETGEVVPGLSVREGSTTFTVKPGDA